MAPLLPHDVARPSDPEAGVVVHRTMAQKHLALAILAACDDNIQDATEPVLPAEQVTSIDAAVDGALGNGLASGYSVAVWRDGEIVTTARGSELSGQPPGGPTLGDATDGQRIPSYRHEEDARSPFSRGPGVFGVRGIEWARAAAGDVRPGGAGTGLGPRGPAGAT